MKTRNLFLTAFLLLNVCVVYSQSLTLRLVDNVPTTSTTIGGGNSLHVGSPSGNTATTGGFNTFIGPRCGLAISTGVDNVFMGYQTGLVNTTGSYNSFLGRSAGAGNTTGSNNTCVGYASGYQGIGNNNTYLGSRSGYNNSGGAGNVFLGNNVGSSVVGTINNRLYIHNNNSNVPLIFGEFDNRNLVFNVNQSITSRFSINSGVAYVAGNTGVSGLRLMNLRNGNLVNQSTSNNKVLSVDANGDVILVNDIQGGISSVCSTANFIPLYSTTSNTLECSQIFDNGTSVGINSTGPFTYTSLSGFQLGTNIPPSSGSFRLDVNGVTRSVAFFASSDKKFKKDIKSIENALTIVQSLEGKTYLWNKEANKEMNFDDGSHSGFIAQELEQVLPHLVATDEKGNKAVNYIELMPYLVEAIKEQQTQINDLKAQLSENFKAQNQDLIELNNTKIISVSPNPSNDVITVSFNVEKSVQSAKLQVHDLNGIVISSLSINDRDNNITRTLQKDNFGKGIYIVSLVVNGKSIDTKKIVFN